MHWITDLPEWITTLLASSASSGVTWLISRPKSRRDEILEHTEAIAKQWAAINAELDRRIDLLNQQLGSMQTKIELQQVKIDTQQDQIEQLELENHWLRTQAKQPKKIKKTTTTT